jgi:hypothetical protein
MISVAIRYSVPSSTSRRIFGVGGSACGQLEEQRDPQADEPEGQGQHPASSSTWCSPMRSCAPR